MRSQQLTIAAVLAVIGVLALIAGIIYLSTPIASLPSFMPGASHTLHGYHNSRGLAGVIFAIILWVVAAGFAIAGLRNSRRRSSSAGRRYYR
jgi:hypothetical protein